MKTCDKTNNVKESSRSKLSAQSDETLQLTTAQPSLKSREETNIFEAASVKVISLSHTLGLSAVLSTQASDHFHSGIHTHTNKKVHAWTILPSLYSIFFLIAARRQGPFCLPPSSETCEQCIFLQNDESVLVR